MAHHETLKSIMKPTIQTPQYELYLGDCLDVLPHLSGVDAVITDPPYGTTACKWDSVIPFDAMWAEINRVAGERTPIVLFGSQPFTSALIISNPKMFKYEWIWDKKMASNFATVKHAPLKFHENILVFSCGKCFYNPQYRSGAQKPRGRLVSSNSEHISIDRMGAQDGIGYPKSIIQEARPNNLTGGGLHPTQKPVALLSYLVKTYTDVGQTVLDFTMGSGTTGVACIQTGRYFIGIEKDERYFNVAAKRLADAAAQGVLFEPQVLAAP